MNKLILTLLISTWGAILSGQTIESFMEKVNSSHPDIIASRQLLTAGEAESRTGLTPDNPVISGGYFPGNSNAPGDKIIWGISQSFDFPTRYSRLKALKKSNLDLAKLEYEYTHIQIMSEAREAAIELIASRELLWAMSRRLENLSQMEAAYLKMMENGETTIVEYNKIRIKKVELLSLTTSLQSEIEMLKVRLDFMSDNSSSILENASYSNLHIQNLNPIMDALRKNHPGFLIPVKRVEASERGIDLTKSENLPGFEIGYGSEIVADERFTGPSLGMSVPIWKNRGKLKRSMAETEYQRKRADSDLQYIENSFINAFNGYISTQQNLAIVEESLEASNNRELLEKSLSEGEISVTEFLIELSSVYELEDMAIELRRQKHLWLSKLFVLDFIEKV